MPLSLAALSNSTCSTLIMLHKMHLDTLNCKLRTVVIEISTCNSLNLHHLKVDWPQKYHNLYIASKPIISKIIFGLLCFCLEILHLWYSFLQWGHRGLIKLSAAFYRWWEEPMWLACPNSSGQRCILPTHPRRMCSSCFIYQRRHAALKDFYQKPRQLRGHKQILVSSFFIRSLDFNKVLDSYPQKLV